MIDATETTELTRKGIASIKSLQDAEMRLLEALCSWATESFMEAGYQAKMSTQNVVLNAYRAGIALGLGLSIKDGQVVGRE